MLGNSRSKFLGKYICQDTGMVTCGISPSSDTRSWFAYLFNQGKIDGSQSVRWSGDVGNPGVWAVHIALDLEELTSAMRQLSRLGRSTMGQPVSYPTQVCWGALYSV